MKDEQKSEDKAYYQFSIFRERLRILHRVEKALELPMVLLSAVWLYLLVAEIVWGLSTFAANMATAIWIMFILDFLLRFSLAPRKWRYLRTNWLTAIALVLPALRIFRVGRVFRVLSRLRGIRVVRILGSINRGMRALGKTMQRRGFGYVIALTAIVTVAGAAGMLLFEREVARESGLDNFWSALWWTAMIMTTMGSEYWPRTAEGRALCLFLAVYAFAVFGYVTGTIATYFIGQDAANAEAEVAGQQGMNRLTEEIALLRKEVAALKPDTKA